MSYFTLCDDTLNAMNEGDGSCLGRIGPVKYKEQFKQGEIIYLVTNGIAIGQQQMICSTWFMVMVLTSNEQHCYVKIELNFFEGSDSITHT